MLGCYRMKPATVANWSQSWEDGCNYTILLLFPSASLESNSGTLTIFPKFMYITLGVGNTYIYLHDRVYKLYDTSNLGLLVLP